MRISILGRAAIIRLAFLRMHPVEMEVSELVGDAPIKVTPSSSGSRWLKRISLPYCACKAALGDRHDETGSADGEPHGRGRRL